MVPKLENAIARMKKTKTVPKRMNAQPRLVITQLNDASANAEKLSAPNRPHSTTPATTTASGAMMDQSMRAFSSSAAWETVSSSARWSWLSPRLSASSREASSLVADWVGPASWVSPSRADPPLPAEALVDPAA